MKLKNAVVGQRVELKVKEFHSPTVGATGTIVHVVGSNIGVQWDNFTYGHRCNDHITGQNGSGWYVSVENLRKLKEITVGSRVRRNDKDQHGYSATVHVGDEGVVTKVLSNVYHIQFEQYGHTSLLKHKVDLVA